ncbi:MAG: ACP S-malonyltransferase [Acidobacteriota bacterium]
MTDASTDSTTAPDPAVVAFTFPGQGSQKVGMGKEWAETSAVVRETFEEADEALGFALSALCWEGPAEDLQLTVNTQPALLATSVAFYRAARAAGVDAAVLAGHSLGEYSALVAAEALDFGDALRLVRERGRLMQEAVPVGLGGMAAILALDDDAVREVAEEVSEAEEVCTPANYNCEGQTVLAGHLPAVERAVELAKARGARKAVLLEVSAPFHSPLMAPAREGLEPQLAETTFRDPRVPVVTNVDAAAATTAQQVRDALVRQVDSAVRWTESVGWIHQGFGAGTFIEVGPGKVLTGLNRRIARGSKFYQFNAPGTIEAYLEKIAAQQG